MFPSLERCHRCDTTRGDMESLPADPFSVWQDVVEHVPSPWSQGFGDKKGVVWQEVNMVGTIHKDKSLVQVSCHKNVVQRKRTARHGHKLEESALSFIDVSSRQLWESIAVCVKGALKRAQ